jgi:homoserine O-acetyltransferase
MINPGPLFISIFTLAAPAPALADGDLQFASLGRCELESGQFIEDCRLGFRTWGQLNDDRSNVIIYPSWYSGTAQELYDQGYIGPGKMADTNQFHVIAINTLGSGISSSPSNSENQPNKNFPEFTIRDMVRVQHRLITEELGLDHVNVVMGASMGGMQAFEWMTTFPDFMDKLIAIEGTPWPSSYDLLLWNAWMDVMEMPCDDPETRERAMSLMAALDIRTLWTPAYYLRTSPAGEFDAAIDAFNGSYREMNFFDRASQTRAMINLDISAPFEDFENRAASLVKADVLVIVFGRDLMVNPTPSLELAGWIGAETLVLDSPCGHMGPDPSCDQELTASAVNNFLSR